MIGNNWYNHVHAMAARGSSPLRFYSSIPLSQFDASNDTAHRKEKMDHAQNICRRLDNIKKTHMLALNNKMLEVLNGYLDLDNNRHLNGLTHFDKSQINLNNIKKDRDYPLGSPSVLGQDQVFQVFKTKYKDDLRKYDEMVSKISNPINAKKQEILRGDSKEKMNQLEQDLMNTLDVSEYFTHEVGLGSATGTQQEVETRAHEIGDTILEIIRDFRPKNRERLESDTGSYYSAQEQAIALEENNARPPSEERKEIRTPARVLPGMIGRMLQNSGSPNKN